MLIDIRDFICARGVCSLYELSTHFKTSPDAMRGMLSHWERKGRVVQEQSGCSKGCVSCSEEHLEMYRWCGAGNKIPLCQIDSR